MGITQTITYEKRQINDVSLHETYTTITRNYTESHLSILRNRTKKS